MKWNQINWRGREREREKRGPHLKCSGPGDVVRQDTTTPAVVLFSSFLYFIHSFILSFFIPLENIFHPQTKQEKEKMGKQKRKKKRWRAKDDREKNVVVLAAATRADAINLFKMQESPAKEN